MTAWVVAYVSRLLSLHCPRDRGAVAGRPWWTWKIGEAWLPKVLYRLLGNTLPRSSMTAHVRATPALNNLAPHDVYRYIHPPSIHVRQGHHYASIRPITIRTLDTGFHRQLGHSTGTRQATLLRKILERGRGGGVVLG